MQFSLSLTYNDICLLPQYSNISSRTEPDLSTWLTTDIKMGIPILAANMNTVINDQLSDILIANGSIPIFHRFTDFETQVKWAQKYIKEQNKTVCFSTGLIDKLEDSNLYKLIAEYGVRLICLDVAHGHSKRMMDMVQELKRLFQHDNLQAVCGNGCTQNFYIDMCNCGANAVKVGIGPGCLKSGTKVLMSNGSYKNIEEIVIGDHVINCEGNPVRVIGVRNSGKKLLYKCKFNSFHKETWATSDHKFLIGDLSNLKKTVISDCGIPSLLDRRDRSSGKKKSRVVWEELKNTSKDGSIFLLPKTFSFMLQDNFKIDLVDYLSTGYISGDKIYTNGNKEKKSKPINRYLFPSYELGYIFGYFLGDGTSSISLNKNTNCWQGRINFYTYYKDKEIIDKLNKYCIKIFGRELINKRARSIIISTLYSKILATFFKEFGKLSCKTLPEKYLCKNLDYIKGLYEGLIDSDGCIEDANNSRIKTHSFYNISEKLIELFYFCCFSLQKTFGASERKKSVGNLKNISIDNLHQSYRVKVHRQNHFSKNFCYHQTYSDLENSGLILDTWDIEVDCPTHSFIANNCIVHNSACTTRVQTGFGQGQFSAVYECAEQAKKYRVPIIADGSIETSGDIVKALAAGASSVMIGKLFALTDESAAKNEVQSGTPMKRYKGQASEEFQNEFYGGLKDKTTAEGTAFWAPVSGSAQKLLDNLTGGIRSGFTYGGARTLKELQRKAEFRIVLGNYMTESKPRPE